MLQSHAWRYVQQIIRDPLSDLGRGTVTLSSPTWHTMEEHLARKSWLHYQPHMVGNTLLMVWGLLYTLSPEVKTHIEFPQRTVQIRLSIVKPMKAKHVSVIMIMAKRYELLCKYIKYLHCSVVLCKWMLCFLRPCIYWRSSFFFFF